MLFILRIFIFNLSELQIFHCYFSFDFIYNVFNLKLIHFFFSTSEFSLPQKHLPNPKIVHIVVHVQF